MSNHKIKFYPVGNGDMVLITLKDSTTILVDSNIREVGKDDSDNQIYDVKNDLLDSLDKKNDNYHLDLFILSHPDEDHCRGYEKHFYQGDPEKYSESNQEKNEIIVDELWVTSILFSNASSDDAKKLKKEAERRRKLWDNDDKAKDKPGNRIRMIGYNGEAKFDNVPSTTPGNSENKINGARKNDFEFFVHSPFKDSLVTATAEKDKNFSCIVLLACFKINSSDSEFSTQLFLGGDADHNIWSKIKEESESHGNGKKLEWDLFLAPHHCSWTFFNDVPYDKDENKEPKQSSLDILNKRIGHGLIIASSKVIKNNDDNPPHYKAMKEYKKTLNKDEDFIELAKEPKEKEPKPVIFKVTSKGPSRDDKNQQNGSSASLGGSVSCANRKTEYGSGIIF